MKKFASIILVLFTILSCQKPVSKDNIQFETISLDKKVYAGNDSLNPAMSIKLSLVYPIEFRNDTTLNKLQNLFVEAFGQGDYKGKSPKGAIEAAEKEYTESASELANAFEGEYELFGECFIEQKTSLFPDSTYSNIITLVTSSDNYMGGAHGSNTINYYCIDLDKVRILSEGDIFEKGYEHIIPRLLSESLLVRYKDSINDVIFDYKSVVPNGNFHFDKEGIVYTFNEYEIAPYSSGIINITIPYVNIDPILKPQYKKDLRK